MPTQMTPEELEEALKSASEVDTYDYMNPEHSDDYIIAALYSMPDGRRFRVVHSSGMDSVFVGAGDSGEWLTETEEKTWTEF